jgi:outer membrane immunogenic protein
MNKRIGLAFASAVLLGLTGLGVASAADMPLKAPGPAPVASTLSGCYVNVGGGYGMWNQNQHTETYPGLVQTTIADTVDGGKGYLGRFGGGCDYQLTGTLSNWVVGVLGDYDVMGLKGTDNYQNVGLGAVFGAPTAGPEKENNAWYIGGRVGYLVTPALLSYVSAGYTQTSFGQQNFTFLNTGISANAFLPGTTFQGWFVGGGTEYALNFFPTLRGLFWRNEYRYASYSSKDIPLLGPGAAPGFGQHSTPSVQTITSSLVWKFNWAQPVVAKY